MSHIQVAGAGTQDPVPQLQRAQRMRPRNGGYHRVGYGRLGFPLVSRHVVPWREYVCRVEMLYVTQHSWTWKRWGVERGGGEGTGGLGGRGPIWTDLGPFGEERQVGAGDALL